jgi:2-haloacid dehalogenase
MILNEFAKTFGDALNRRKFLQLTTGTLAAALESASLGLENPVRSIRAIAFDALAIYDPSPVFARAESLYPGKGAELRAIWRTRQFEYTWLRTASKHYADFWQVTEEALVFALKSLKLDLDADKRTLLMKAYLDLKPWPDVPPVLAAMKESGIRLALLSNFTPLMLEAVAKSSMLDRSFEHLLSTDVVRTFKPDPRAYQLAIDAFKLDREHIAFVAYSGWDAAGARTFGFLTFWANRQNLPSEELGVAPDASGATLEGLPQFLATRD